MNADKWGYLLIIAEPLCASAPLRETFINV